MKSITIIITNLREKPKCIDIVSTLFGYQDAQQRVQVRQLHVFGDVEGQRGVELGNL